MLVSKTLCTVSGAAGFLSGNLLLLLAVVGVNLVVGALLGALTLLLSLLTGILLDLFFLLLGLVDLGADTSVRYSVVRPTLCNTVYVSAASYCPCERYSLSPSGPIH